MNLSLSESESLIVVRKLRKPDKEQQSDDGDNKLEISQRRN